MKGKIFVVSGPGQGHISPCLELCKHLTSLHYNSTLVIPSSVPNLPSFPHIEIAPIPFSSSFPAPESDPFLHPGASDLESHLAKHSNSTPLCAIIDFQLGWTKNIFWKFDVPVIGLFTFGACAAAMEWAAWKAEVRTMKPADTCLLPGLPEQMALSYSDIQRKNNPPPRGGSPPKPGDRPPWVKAVEGSVALMFNTSDDLERPFLTYMADQMAMPAWGVGPLLSAAKTSNCRNTETNVTEDEIIRWLDAKPPGSVLYVAFGTEVGPTELEYPRLAEALEESTRPFIWVIQSKSEQSYFPHGMDARVGERGLILHGWAPQLMILSHQSIGGFLSHCGWNSTAEAISRGVPIVAWPKRGDQYYNAKLVVSYLKIGHMATSGDASKTVAKDDIVKGIEKLMTDEEARNRAAAIRRMFESGFPESSEKALNAFGDFISKTIKV